MDDKKEELTLDQFKIELKKLDTKKYDDSKIKNIDDLKTILTLFKDNSSKILISCDFLSNVITISASDYNFYQQVLDSVNIMSYLIPHKRIYLTFKKKDNIYSIKLFPIVTSA